MVDELASVSNTTVLAKLSNVKIGLLLILVTSHLPPGQVSARQREAPDCAARDFGSNKRAEWVFRSRLQEDVSHWSHVEPRGTPAKVAEVTLQSLWRSRGGSSRDVQILVEPYHTLSAISDRNMARTGLAIEALGSGLSDLPCVIPRWLNNTTACEPSNMTNFRRPQGCRYYWVLGKL